jgi:hypothetical protein
VGNPKLESLLDRLLLGDTPMRHGNFKPPMNRLAHASIESGQVLLSCLHTCNLARMVVLLVQQRVEKQLEGEITLRPVLRTHAEQNDVAAAQLGIDQSRTPGDRRFA